MRWLIAIVFYISLLGISSQCEASNPPTPSSGNAQAQHQTNAAQKHTDSHNTNETSSSSVRITQDQPVSQHGISSQPKQESHWYSTPDWWIAGFTGCLFIATSGLWIVTAFMWNATSKHVDLARKEFISTHRPRIKVGQTILSLSSSNNQEYGLSVLCRNSGESDGHIIEIKAGFLTVKNSQVVDPSQTKFKTFVVENSFKNGDEKIIKTDATIVLDNVIKADWANEDIRIFVIGSIRYKNDIGGVYTTGFFRRWDSETGSWITQKGNPREFED